MASWSAENATKAYLSAFKMGERSKEPDVTEFISAIAAGNNAQTMVVTSASSVPDSTILLAMLAAAHQTQGRVICIVAAAPDHLNNKNPTTEPFLGNIEFLVGEPHELLLTSEPCNKADFIVVDCELENQQEIFNAAVCVGNKNKRRKKKTVVVGYNAMKCNKGTMMNSWGCFGGTRTQLLPIGKGLLVSRFGEFGGNNNNNNNNNVVVGNMKYCGSGLGKFRSRWVVKVDKCTGEEHVFRVRLPHDKVVPA